VLHQAIRADAHAIEGQAIVDRNSQRPARPPQMRGEVQSGAPHRERQRDDDSAYRLLVQFINSARQAAAKSCKASCFALFAVGGLSKS
jgi:hypothetical protein